MFGVISVCPRPVSGRELGRHLGRLHGHPLVPGLDPREGPHRRSRVGSGSFAALCRRPIYRGLGASGDSQRLFRHADVVLDGVGDSAELGEGCLARRTVAAHLDRGGFSTPSPGVGRMWLPRPFVKSLLQMCRQFLIYNFLPLSLADALVGRAGRVAHVLCHTRPFVSSLYKALSESLRARGCKAREAPPAKVACRRYRHGARWLIRILGFKDRGAPVPNCRDVVARPLPPPDPQARRMEIDASPTGAGGILFEGGVPTRFFSCEWRPEDFEGRDVHIGSSASQM